MSFAALFDESTIVRDLRSEDRDGCFQELLDALVASRRLPKKEAAKALDAIRARERVGSTGIGGGVAIPHVKLEGVPTLAAALGIHRSGVDFRAIDGEAVQIVFFVVRPPDDAADHLRFLRWVSRLGRSRDFKKFVIAANSDVEVLSLLEEMSED
jgi:nitrogen PTS system EIIA component